MLETNVFFKYVVSFGMVEKEDGVPDPDSRKRRTLCKRRTLVKRGP